MTQSRPEALRSVDRALADFQAEYRDLPGLIVREKDLQCALYRKLAQVGYFMEPNETPYQGVFAPRLHAELHWFLGSSGRKVTPDLSILNPANIAIGDEGEAGVRLSEQSRRFREFAILIELKYAGHSMGIRKYEVGSVGADVQKIETLRALYDSAGYQDCFDIYFIVASRVEFACEEYKIFVRTHAGNPRYHFVELFGGLAPSRKLHVRGA